MSQNLEEQLSAFLDGELPDAELELLLARLERDPARRQVLARYAMIGETVRTGTARPEALALTERVRVALLTEERLTRRRPALAPARAWWGWVAGGMAAAAALAAVLVTGPTAQQGATAPVVSVAPAATGLLDEPISPVRSVASYRLNPGAAARLTGYMVAHGEYTNQLSRNNFDSRLVSARAERASWQRSQDLVDVR